MISLFARIHTNLLNYIETGQLPASIKTKGCRHDTSITVIELPIQHP